MIDKKRRQPAGDVQQHQQGNDDGLRQPAKKTAAQRRGGVRGGGLFFPAALLSHRGGDSGQLAVAINGLHAQRSVAFIRAQNGNQPRRQQRVSAKVVEKIRFRLPCAARKKFAERGVKRPLLFVARLGGLSGSLRHRLERKNAQGILINLAGSQAGQFGHQFKMRRHHVMRKPCGQSLSPSGRLHFLICRRNNKSDHLIHSRQRAQHRSRRDHAGLGRQRGADFVQLDAEAADFHLAVRAAQAMHLPAGLDARQIAGEIHFFLAGFFRERIWNEFFRRQVRPAKITGRQSRPENAQLAGFARRQRTPLRVHNHQTVIRQRLSDVHGFARLQFRRRRRHRGFGRAVGVEKLSSRPRQPMRQRFGAGFAAEIDQPQSFKRIVHQTHQRRNRVQHRDAFARQGLREKIRIAHKRWRRNPERRAGEVGNPDFLERHVEGRREALVNPVGFAHAQNFIFAAEQMTDAALADDDALGLARRAGSVNHISRVGRFRGDGKRF